MIYHITKEGRGSERHKVARPVKNREALMALRNSTENLQNLDKARQGDHAAKANLVQLAYNIGHVGERLAGCKSQGSFFFHDVDCYDKEQSEATKALILSKKDEIGLRMLERSVSGGWHLVCQREQGKTILENQVRVACILKLEMDTSAKDLQRVVFSTSGTAEDLPYLDDAIFEEPMSPEACEKEYAMLKVRVMRKQEELPEGARKANKHYRPWESLSAAPIPGQSVPTAEQAADRVRLFKGRPYSDIIDAWWQRNGGVPQEGERNVKLYQLAVNLRGICDNSPQLLMQVMPRLGLDEQELRSIVESACKEPPKGLSKVMREIVEKYTIGSVPLCTSEDNINQWLWDWGAQIEALSEEFPVLKDVCKGLKRNQYPAALIVAGAFGMTLMTRCTYRFYHRPEELRRLNSSALIIGDPASGKSFATRLFKLLAAPIVAADKVGRDAINAYREQMRTKGANKEKPKKPKVVVRVHPARTSNAQFIQDMVNAVEMVDGEEMHLHMLTFDTELDNTVTVQKGGSWIDKQSMELKAFHNEEDGQAYSNVDSILQDFKVYWNYVYTGTPIALKKKVTEQNFGSGLATRLTVIPLPATNFEMMARESHVDFESDNRLKAWAEKLDRTKGLLPMDRIVDELYDWTARRMADAKENDSKADEMLLKRCAYHGLNYSVPFIVMRHWGELKKDGDYWYGKFETDEVDWRLAELITNIQYACQRHYFGAMAEAYFDNKLKDASVNVQRRQKTIEAFARLPEEFTNDDVMRCFNLSSDSSARTRTSRLLRDHLIEKVRDEKGNAKALFRKTNNIML